ncbi:MAG: putative lipid II flippase FtsW [Oscillibacter sp.]|nr:putative lipid II flippase FtsW [Oscillibacter sp.]
MWHRLRDAADVLRGKSTVAAPRRREEPSRTPEERRARAEARKKKKTRDRQIREKTREKERESRELASGPLDLPFCLLILLLTAVGLVMLLSASFPYAYYKMQDPVYFFRMQGIFALAGICFMLIASRINYENLRPIAKLFLIVSIVLLVLVLIPGIGKISHNARRWIGVGSLFRFQPSEITKLAVIIWFSYDISRKREKMRTFQDGILPYMKIMGVIAVLMMLEPHLSGTILILGTGAVLMLVGGIQLRWVLGAIGGAGFVAFLMIKGIIPYGQSRIAMWKNPFIDAQGQGYQLVQSLISIGSGGLFGVGLGKSRQKFLYLPEEHNDFIFAVVCEELGLIGATLIMLLFAAMILRGYWIALHARDRFGSLLVTGVITQMAMQTFFNIGVVTGFLPTTGISLPFFSYGGTAILIQLAEMGIVLSVSRQMKL